MKYLIALLLCISLNVAALEHEPAYNLNQALDYEKQAQLPMAQRVLASLYLHNKQDMALSLVYGRVLVKRGEAAQAAVVLMPFARADNPAWQVWFWLGSAYLLEGKLGEAEFYLDEALAREGEEIAIWVQRAMVAQEQKNPQASLYMLQVAANLNPQHPSVLLNSAYAYEGLNDWDNAIINYRQFLKHSSADKQYARVRSQVLLRLTKIGAAIEQHNRPQASKAKTAQQPE